MSDRQAPRNDDVMAKPSRKKGRGAMPDFVQPDPDPLAPKRPVNAAPSKEVTATWMSNFFRVKGWKSKDVQQKALKSGLQSTIGQQLGQTGPDNAQSLKTDRTLKAGMHFNNYVSWLEAYEKAPEPRDAVITGKLKEAAQLVVDEVGSFSKKGQDRAENARKLQICRAKLDQLAIEVKSKTIGDPPWDSETSMSVAGLKAEADIASLPLNTRSPQHLDGDGANCSFWINQAGDDPSKPDQVLSVQARRETQ